MSFKAMLWVDKIHPLTPVDRLVLLYLARCADSKNQCWPSKNTIAAVNGIGRTSTYRSIDILEGRGLITISPNKSKNGRDTSSTYTLNMWNYGVSHHETGGSQGGTPLSQGGTLILESSSESSLNLSEAETVVSAMDSDFDQNWESSKMGIQTQILDSEVYAAMKTDELLNSQKTLTVEQAIDKAKKGKKSYTSTGLSGLWRDLNIVFNTGVFQKPFSIPDMGKFTHIMKTEGVDAGRVMVAVIRNWIGFGKYLKDQGLVHDYPDGPHIGFFLKHLGMAVEFSKKSIEPPSELKLKMYVPAN